MQSKAMTWAGRILSTLLVLFLLMGIVMGFAKRDEMAKEFVKFGYPSSAFLPLLVVELVCVVLYMLPQTAVLGCILLTGYLGGAVSTHVRAQDGMFWMPVLFGVLFWLALYFRDSRVRALIPLRR